MNEQASQYQQLIAKCWADEAFKARLMAAPAETLTQEGFEIPTGVNVQVHENTETQLCIVIPQRPTELSDDAISAVGAGVGLPWWVPKCADSPYL
ncbi:NHLP leader peptide family RiPP precursor [uncultured Thiohalocapsa sp.]|uniref:NHLP leader peptide family RiPP precursor n=1 Tax=uncultured Thiohalocapsa sp. TaxID=768990 RepID=UPI0025E8AC0E|nr:NHLP leader peptide family RiPP precursor [uncultured Thiohalocapsa sp.]